MNYYCMLKIIQLHPEYKKSKDSLRRQMILSRKGSEICWGELSQRLRDHHKVLLDFIESQYAEYKILEEGCRLRRAKGWGFIVFGEALYPQSFYLTEDPPLTLSYFGLPSWSNHHSFSVVGSRNAREESLIWMEKELGAFIEKNALHVVSGGARGVDQKAHSLAIRKNLPTTVILPSGLDQLYPSNLQAWVRPVLDTGGCFLSEYSFSQKMQKFLFHHRNRLIAALGTMVLVVEARKRSGTLITAQQAALWGRPVLVVPGHPHDTHFGGSLHLLSEGAVLVRDAQDLDSIFRAELWSGREANAGVEVRDEIEH